MSKLINYLIGWSIIGIVLFAFVGKRNQEMIISKIGQHFGSDTQDVKEFIKNMREDNTNGGTDYDKTKYSQETNEYFQEIAMGTEDGRRYEETFPYTTDVVIFMEGHQPQYIIDELNKIVKELNDIIDPISLKTTNNKSDANMIISIGSYKTVSEKYSQFKNTMYQNCNGGFGRSGNNSTIFLNTGNIRSVQHAKHVLREEVTQALGLMNDSYKYPESVFYEGVSEVTEYAPIDRELIDILYNN